MIKIQQLVKKVQEDVILDDLSLEIGKGLTFITGSSGSGKSTLLRVIAGIDGNYSGDVQIGGQSLADLKDRQKSYLANSVLGFVWQDYRLLEELTVEENIQLPLYLKKDSAADIKKAMADLNILSFAKQKVKDLSGGQKQRVAIARELMKEPEIILADEPTSALDKETAKQIMAIFRELAKTRTVVVVTHDQTNITPKDTVFEMAHGQIVAKKTDAPVEKKATIAIEKNKGLGFGAIFQLLTTNLRRHPGRFLIAILTLLVGTGLLMTSIGDNVEQGNQESFDAIYDVYGPGVLDIGLYGSFMSAAGTDEDSNDGPSGDVNQEIQHLYKRYSNDPRVAFTAYIQAFDEIEVSLDSQTYAITSSGNMPVINHLVAGNMPTGDGNEVVVPESFAKQLGKAPKELLGQEIDFSAKMVRWENDNPIFEKTQTKAVIVGVMDTTITMNYEGEYFEYVIEDAFLFSQQALDHLLSVMDKKATELSFVVRAKTAQDMIAIRDELNQEGIVPTGNFEVVEDLVALGNQSATQTDVVNQVMIAIVVVLVAAVYAFSAFMRQREYAIFKLSGCDKGNLTKLTISEMLLQGIVTFVGLVLLSPVINKLSTMFFAQKMLTVATLPLLVLLLFGLVVLGAIVTDMICRKRTIMQAFKVGKK